MNIEVKQDRLLAKKAYLEMCQRDNEAMKVNIAKTRLSIDKNRLDDATLDKMDNRCKISEDYLMAIMFEINEGLNQ